MPTKIRFRPLDGLLLLDKPQGLSSNAALQAVRRLFAAEKGGHTGSLDPLATGLLPLCFGEATKIAGLLLGARKAYETTAVLGRTTDSDDADGTTLRQCPVPTLTAQMLEDALAPLRGSICQRAPIYSALKQGGEPLYAKARRGETITAPQRQVQVHAIEVVEIAGESVRLRIECGSGTYIRSLVRDLGETLGCGAHVGQLRRLWVEPFLGPQMYTLEALEALAGQGDAALCAALLPIETGLSGFPRCDLSAPDAHRFGQGQRLKEQGQARDTVAVYGPTGRVLGLARVDAQGVLVPQRLFHWAVWRGPQSPDSTH